MTSDGALQGAGRPGFATPAVDMLDALSSEAGVGLTPQGTDTTEGALENALPPAGFAPCCAAVGNPVSGFNASEETRLPAVFPAVAVLTGISTAAGEGSVTFCVGDGSAPAF